MKTQTNKNQIDDESENLFSFDPWENLTSEEWLSMKRLNPLRVARLFVHSASFKNATNRLIEAGEI